MLDIGEHFGVAEEHEVGVEDQRFLGPDLPSGHGSNALDLPTHGGDGLNDATPLSSCGTC